MLEYDGDLHIPSRFLVEPPHIQNTMGELFAKKGITQLAISETQKFGHVTYFWNGNRRENSMMNLKHIRNSIRHNSF